jgi:transposase
MTPESKVLGIERIASQPYELAQAMAKAGEEPEVVLESTYGWAADVLQELSARVHLAHALGNNWGHRRVKNDERDAKDFAAMLRLGRLAEGWIAPPEIRELRELVRYRFSLVRHRTSAKAQIHGVMAKNGILPVVSELWGPAGQAQLDSLELPEAYALRLASLLSCSPNTNARSPALTPTSIKSSRPTALSGPRASPRGSGAITC